MKELIYLPLIIKSKKDTKKRQLHISTWQEKRKYSNVSIANIFLTNLIFINIKCRNDTSKRTAFLIEASNCARCVTAPAKQYDMFRLKQAINQNLEEVPGQNIPTQ